MLPSFSRSRARLQRKGPPAPGHYSRAPRGHGRGRGRPQSWPSGRPAGLFLSSRLLRQKDGLSLYQSLVLQWPLSCLLLLLHALSITSATAATFSPKQISDAPNVKIERLCACVVCGECLACSSINLCTNNARRAAATSAGSLAFAIGAL